MTPWVETMVVFFLGLAPMHSFPREQYTLPGIDGVSSGELVSAK